MGALDPYHKGAPSMMASKSPNIKREPHPAPLARRREAGYGTRRNDRINIACFAAQRKSN
jgi:hypothetical protein